MKEGFIIYTAYAKKFRRLSDAQFGQLVRALIDYQATGIEPEITDAAVGMAFDVVKVEVDAANVKYYEIVEKRREAAKSRGQANESKSKQMLANASKCNQEQPNDSYKDKDKEKDKEKDKGLFTVITVNKNSPRESAERENEDDREIMLEQFNAFWAEYPKHENKDAACRMWISLNPGNELAAEIIKAVRENKAKNGGWKRNGGRYIPRADKWLLDRRWLDEIHEETDDPTPQKKNQFNDYEQRQYTKQDYDELELKMRRRGLKREGADK